MDRRVDAEVVFRLGLVRDGREEDGLEEVEVRREEVEDCGPSQKPESVRDMSDDSNFGERGLRGEAGRGVEVGDIGVDWELGVD